MDEQVKNIISLALREDLGSGDITTEAIYSGNHVVEARLIAKEPGVLAGLDVAGYIFRQLDPQIKITGHRLDGEQVDQGNFIALIKGRTDAVLKGERTALNFLQRMSGIATRTRNYVNLISDTRATILDTRKTTPGLRLLDKQAVRTGGGENHRTGLFDRYLIKENHINVAGGITEAIDKCVKHRENISEKLLIEAEVKNLDEVKEAIAHKECDIILLDNMSLGDMSEAVELANEEKKLEASGNVSEHTVRDIAETGVDYISIGELTHSVKALDISLLFID